MCISTAIPPLHTVGYVRKAKSRISLKSLCFYGTEQDSDLATLSASSQPCFYNLTLSSDTELLIIPTLLLLPLLAEISAPYSSVSALNTVISHS